MKTYLAWLLLFLTASGFAQEPQQATKSMAPQAPLVANPLPGTQWTVNISRPRQAGPGSEDLAESPPPNDQPVQITTQNGKDNRLDEIRWGDGNRTSAYYTGVWCFMESRDGTRVIPFRIPSGSPDAGVSIFTRGYVGTEWIHPNLFQGTEKIGDVLCHVYRRDPLPPPAADDSNPAVGGHQNLIDSVGLAAYIDAETRRPVLIVIDAVNYDYTEWKDGSLDIPIPAKIKPTFEAVKAQLGGNR